MAKKYLLVDGNALIFRAFFSSFGRATLTTKSGIPTNAVYSFINMLMNIALKNDYFDIKIAFDKGKKTFRHDKLEDYKGKRQKTPIELIEQFPIVREFLTSAKIDWYELDFYEADDIIGTLTRIIENKDNEAIVHILTSDQDMYQLISDNTFVLSPQTGTSDISIIDKQKLFEKWGIKPEQVIDYKGLRGDTSDNIKGVAGIGEKTAKELLQQFNSLEDIYDNIDKITGAKQQKLVADKKNAFLSKEIATIVSDIEIENLNFRQYSFDYEGMKKFFVKYEMNSLIKKFASNQQDLEPEKIVFKVLKKWDQNFQDAINWIYLETFQENYHLGDAIGISISNSKGNFYYELNLTDEINIFNWNEVFIDEEFQNFLSNSIFKTYDLKKTIVTLTKMGYKINETNFTYDMMLGCYIINSNVKSNFESHVALINSTIEIKTFDEVFGKGVKKTKLIDQKIKHEFLIQKVLLIKELEQKVINILIENKQYELYEKIELPFSKVLLKMELEGILIDKTELDIQTKNILELLINLENEIKNDLNDYISQDFNLASPKQLKELLYLNLKLPDYNKGSTDKETLELLEDKHPVISKIISFRKYSKLYSTYLKGFEKFIHSDNKVHTIFNQTLTNTGRLSSSYPNIQNISVRDEEQKNVRKIFISQKGYSFFSFDYSQIELRVLGDIVNEDKLIEIFSLKRDIHSEAARSIFNLKEDEKVNPEQRRVAKVFNFGILYGLSDFGLAKDLKIPIFEAKSYIKSYYEAFPKILDFKRIVTEFAYQNSYVETMANRRRYIYELKNSNYMVKQFGERAAVNAPIQGTAADILKVAMIDIENYFKENNFDSKMVAQIHDEVIILVSDNEAEEIKKNVIEIMQNSYNNLLKIVNKNRVAKIDLEINFSKGKSWFELK
ncbi:DNA polymerase I [Spiroplasma taiwanense]|uniref:DNA polymerase I n=1 Tax=Spiroplasma taiwanense CT-1 TaxID=1276220 RepID=S5LY82_9MOLU|nr:DNA polymerase I [Spiroplasma taiwanense]AGR41546.1 DNA polymerase I [Spiroplasma taiwanense CT-1]